MEYLLFSWIYSTCLRNDMSYYFSCKTANTSSIVLVCSVCYCYEIFSYKLPINIHVHIRKKHMIDLIMFYDKKKPQEQWLKRITLWRIKRIEGRKKESQYKDYKTVVNLYIDIYFSASPSPIILNTSLSLKSITKPKSQ